MELARTCGSSGMICAQSGRDLLLALHECSTSLPHKAGASKITCFNQYCYWIAYRHVAAQPEDRVVSFKYLVPRRGGSFEIQPSLVARHPSLPSFLT